MVTNEQENGATTWTVADTKNLTIEGERSSGTLIAKGLRPYRRQQCS